MKRRDLLKAAITLPLLPLLMRSGTALAHGTGTLVTTLRSRVRPGQTGWPATAEWERLKRNVGGRLLKLEPPFAQGAASPALKQLANPFAVGDNPALTLSSGWADAWTSQPSSYAVAAENTADVVAAVNFARQHHLRLVVKGGGHSYQGTSDAPDSLLVWTRHMNKVSLHDAFVPQGCAGHMAPQTAVSVQAGAMWIDAYNAVTTHGGRYVQGGGCTTVGVAGLVQSGGFGSFSKNWGTAASNLLEAEVVTADGQVRIANARTNPELFWGLKGGGGGSLGVLTRLTLRTFELPEFFGVVAGTIQADSDAAYRALIAAAMDFYQRAAVTRSSSLMPQISATNFGV
jgi:FAD/FMN-containing dehydrogenase